MSNNDQTIQFPVALKPLLTDFVVNVLRDRIPSNQLSSYAAQYFSERQQTQSYPSTSDSQEQSAGVFLTNQTSGVTQASDDSVSGDKQRRKSVWGGSPVCSRTDVFLASRVDVHSRIPTEI